MRQFGYVFGDGTVSGVDQTTQLSSAQAILGGNTIDPTSKNMGQLFKGSNEEGYRLQVP